MSKARKRVRGSAAAAEHPFAVRRIAAAVQAACLPAVGLALGLQGAPALAGPQGGQVVAGQGSIARPDATTTVVHQQSQNLALDWRSFDVASNELVQFRQPGRTASALNRIFDQKPSEIYGRLEANGRVFLMNPNGVFFGPTARVSVGGLVAAGQGIDVDDFMAGNYRLESVPDTDGVVINQGVIEAAAGGSVTLSGNAVANEGVIVANAGRVNLVAGSRVVLDFDGDGLMRFAVEDKVLENARSLDAAVSNSGTVQADGGMVLLEAHAAQSVFDQAINNSGVVKAARIERSGGVIRLVGAGDGASVLNTGTLSANGTGGAAGHVGIDAAGDTVIGDGARISAASDSATGGTVHLTGARVGLAGDVIVDASGGAGGGEILVGGDFQGSNPAIRNARVTYVGEGVTLTADALANGDGGKVIVWSDHTTQYYANISARGGAVGGDGGFVEVSGKERLAFDGGVDTGAPAGRAGRILLDPRDILITDATTTDDNQLDPDVPNLGDPAGEILFADDKGGGQDVDDFTISDEALEALTGNITLQANRDIVVGAGLSGGLTLVNQGAGETVTFTAGQDIVVDSPITTSGAAISMTANSSASSGTFRGAGGIDINATVSTAGALDASGDITLTVDGGTGVIDLGADLTTDGGTVTLNGPVVLSSAVVIDTDAAGGTTAAGDVLFGTSAVDGAFALSIDTSADSADADEAAGSVTLGAVGTTTPLASLAVDTRGKGAGADGTVTLGGDVAVDGGGAVDLTNAAGGVVLAAAVVIDTDAAGGATDAGAVTLPVVDGTTAGAESLTIDATADGGGGAGDVTLAGAVGGGVQLGALSVTGGAVSVDSVEVTGAISVAGTGVTLTGTLYQTNESGGADTITFTGPVDLAAGATIDVATAGGTGDDVTFAAAVDDTGSDDHLRVDAGAAGAVDFQAAVGAGSALGQLTVLDAAQLDIRDATATGAIALTATNIDLLGTTYASTGGGVTFDGDVALDAGAVTVAVSGAGITFTGDIDDAASDTTLSLDGGTGTVELQGDAGAAGRLKSLLVTTTGDVSLQDVMTDFGTIRVGTNATTRVGTLTLNGDLVSHDEAGGDAGSIELYADDIRLEAAGAGTAGSIDLDTAASDFGGTAAPITVVTDTVGGGTLASATAFEDGIELDAGTSTLDISGATLVDLDHLVVTADSVTLGTLTVGDGAGNGGVALEVDTTNDLTLEGDLATTGEADAGAVDLTGVGGNIVLADADGTVSITTDAAGTDADLALGAVVDGGPGDVALTLAAGTGDVTLNGAVGTGADPIGALTVSGNDIAFAADVEAAGVTATALQAGADDDSIAVAAGVTLDANGGGIDLASDDIAIDATAVLTSTGAAGQAVTFRGETAGTSIGVGDLAAGTLNLSEAELQRVDGTFDRIVVGTAGTQSGTITVDDTGGLTGLATSLELRADMGEVDIAGAIDLSATPGAGFAVFGDGNTTTLRADIVTAGGEVRIDDTVLIDGAVRIDTTATDTADAAKVTVTGAIDGLNAGGTDALTVDAARGSVDGTADADVDLQGPAGTGVVTGANDLEGLTIEGGEVFVDDVVVDGSIDIAGAPTVVLRGTTYTANNSTGTESITISGPIDLEAGGATITFTTPGAAGEDISFDNTVRDVGSDDTLVLDAGAGGNVSIQGDIGAGGDKLAAFTVISAAAADLANVAATGAISVTATSINLNGASYASDGGTITLTGAVDLAGSVAVTIDSDADGLGADGAITISGALTDSGDDSALTIDANTDQVELGDVAVDGALSVTGGNIVLNGTSYTSNDGDITFDATVDLASSGLVTIDSDADTDGIDGLIEVTGAIDDPGNDSSLTVDAGTDTVTLADVTVNDALTVTGGTIELAGNDYRSKDGAIILNGAIDLIGAGAVTLDSDADLDATDGAIALNGDVTDTGADSSLTVTADTGQVDLANVIVAGSLDFTGGGIDLNGTVYRSTAAGAITFNSPVDLDTGFATTITVQTAGGAGDDISFTSIRALANEALTLDAGLGGDIIVSGAIGSATTAEKLSNLTVTNAASATFDDIFLAADSIGNARTTVVLSITADAIVFTGGANSIVSDGTGDVTDVNNPEASPGASSGIIVLQPNADTTGVKLGGTAPGAGTLHITAASFDAIGDDFVVINVGNSTNSAQPIFLDFKGADKITLQDPLRTRGTHTLDGAVAIAGGSDGHLITTAVGNRIITDDIVFGVVSPECNDAACDAGDFIFDDFILIGDDATNTDGILIDSKGNPITFNETLDSTSAADADGASNKLTLNAWDGLALFGTITFADDIGATNPLGDLTIVNAGQVIFAADTIAAGSFVATANQFTFNDGGSGTTGIAINGETGATSGGGTAPTSLGLDLSGVPDVDFSVDLAIDTTVGSGTDKLVDLSGGAIDPTASRNLTITAGTADVTLGAIGQGGGAVPILAVNSAGQVFFNGDVSASALTTIDNVATRVVLGADVDLVSGGWDIANVGAGGIQLSGGAGSSNSITGLSGTVNLAAITDTGAPDQLTVSGAAGITLAGVDITGLLDVNVDTDDNGSNVVTLNGDVSAGQIQIDGTGGNDSLVLGLDVDVIAAGGPLDLATNLSQIQLSGNGGTNIIETLDDQTLSLAHVLATGSPGASLTARSGGDVDFTAGADIGTGTLAATADSDDDGAGAVIVGGIIAAGPVTLSGGGTGTNDSADINADVVAGGALVLENFAAGVDLAANVDLTGAGITATSNVSGITLSGAAGTTNNITSTGDANTLAIAPVTVSGGDNNLTLRSHGDLDLSTASINLGAGDFSATADSDNDSVQTLTIAGGITAGGITLSGGTDGDDIIDIDQDLSAATFLTIENAGTVDLAGDVDLEAGSGDLTASNNVGTINFSGAASTSNRIESLGGSVDLAPLADSGAPDQIEIVAAGDITLSSADLANILSVEPDEDGDEAATLTAGNLSAGTIEIEGFGGDEIFNLNGSITSTTFGVLIDDAGQVNFGGDVTAATALTVSNVVTGINLAQNVDLVAQAGDVDLNNLVTQIDLAGAGGTNRIAASDGIGLAAIVDTGGASTLDIDLDTDLGGATLTAASITAGTITINGTGADDTVNLDGDVQSTAGGVTIDSADVVQVAAGVTVTGATTLAINNVNTALRLGANAVLRANGGAMDVATGVTEIQLTGAGGTNVIDGNGDALVDLANIRTTGATDADLTVTSEGSIDLRDVDLGAGDLLATVDDNDNGGETLTLLTGILNVGAGSNLAGGGTGANDTLQAADIVNTWNVTGSGTLNGVAFDDFDNLSGGNQNDTFTFTGTGNVTGTLDGGAGGTNTIDWSALGARDVTLTGSDADGFDGTEASVGAFVNINVIVGSAAGTTDALTGQNAGPATWTIDGGPDETYEVGGNTLTFSNFENLTGGDQRDIINISVNHAGNVGGGAGDDDVTISNDAVLTGDVDGGPGTDTIFLGTNIASDEARIVGSVNGGVDNGGGLDTLDFSGNALDHGLVTTLPGTDHGTSGVINVGSTFALVSGGFDNIDNLVGNGKGPLLGPAGDTFWEITGVNAGRFRDLGGGPFTNFANFTVQAQGGTDVFVLENAGQLTGAVGIDGGLGTNTLRGDTDPYTWVLDAANGGNVTNLTGVTSFVNIDIIEGSTGDDIVTINAGVGFTGDIDGRGGDDRFTFQDGARILANGAEGLAGALDGGAGSDTVSWAAYTSARNVVLTASDGDGFDGTEASVAGGFANVDEIIGGTAADSLRGQDADATWRFDDLAADPFTYTVGGNTLVHSSFFALTGGTGNDTFEFDNAAVHSGSIDGGTTAGDTGDLLDYSGYGSARDVVLAGPGTFNGFAGTEASGSITAGYDNINAVTASAFGDNLTAPDTTNNWIIDGPDSFRFDTGTVPFTGFTSLTGGNGIDNFFFEADGRITGGIDGGGGINTVNGSDSGDTWVITGAREGTIAPPAAGGATTFTRIDNVNTATPPAGTGGAVGGDGDDTFTLNASFSGTLAGNGGNDVYNANGFEAGSFLGGTGDDTLNGGDAARTWTVSGVNTGTLDNAARIGVSNYGDIEKLVGGTAQDTFVFTAAGAQITGIGGVGIDGVGAGANALQGSPGNDTLNLTGTDQGDIVTGGLTTSFVNVSTVSGGGGNDTVNLQATASFTAVGGGAGNDTFNLTDGAQVTGNIDGGADTDTLVGDDVANQWTVNAVNSGNVVAPAGANVTIDFVAIENLTGGTQADTFTVNAPLGGAIAAGEGDNVINATAAIGGPITSGAGNDTFTLGGVVGGSINAGDGTNNITITGGVTGSVTTGAGGDTITVTNATVTGNVLAGAGNDLLDVNGIGRVNGFFDGSTGTDTVNLAGVPAAVTVTLGGNVRNTETVIGSGNDNLVARANTNNTWNITGPLGGTINDGTLTTTFNGFNVIRSGAGTDTFIVPTSYAGLVQLVGDAVWRFSDGAQLGGAIQSAGADGRSLTVIRPPGTPTPYDVTIGPGGLQLPTLTGYTGDLIIGGVLTPASLPVDGTTTADVQANNLRVETDILTGGDLGLFASNVTFAAGTTTSAGGPGGGNLTVVAVGTTNGGSDPGDITAEGDVTFAGGSATLIAANDIVNAGNIGLDLGGGPVQVAVGPNADDPQFDLGRSNATGGELSQAVAAFLASLNIDAQGVLVVFLNPGAALAKLAELGFVDISVFEQELELVGQIGSGIALSLDQCEELEGCAPNVTEEQIVEIIAALEARIDELERRRAEGREDPERVARLIAGFREQLAQFRDLQQQLAEYKERQTISEFGVEEFGEEFGDDFGDEAPAVEEPAAPEEEFDLETDEPPDAVEEAEEAQEAIEDAAPEPPAPAGEDEAVPDTLEDEFGDEFEPGAARDLPVMPAVVSAWPWVERRSRAGGTVLWTGDAGLPRRWRRY